VPRVVPGEAEAGHTDGARSDTGPGPLPNPAVSDTFLVG
jgi:hypothetical protein